MTSPIPTRPTPRAAFTLLEVMVVVAILAVLASMAVPRMVGTERRQFELVVDEVADLLTMYAQRDQLGVNPVGLQYDRAGRRLLLVSLDVVDEGQSGSVQPSEWTLDRFVAPVTLPPVVDADMLNVYVDGETVFISDEPLTHQPGERRPNVEIELQSTSREQVVTLILAPHAVAPRRVEGRDEVATARMPIDLDAAGRSRENW